MIETASALVLSLRSWFLALLLLPTPPAGAGGRDVAVLVRGDVPVYARFAERFRRACDCSARRVELGSDPGAAAEAVRALMPGAVVAVGRSGLRAARTHLPDVPVVHAMVVNPWSVAGSAGRVGPGVPVNVDPEESLAVLQQLVPGARTVVVVSDPAVTGPGAQAADRAARRLGLTLDVRRVHDVAAAPKALEGALPTADAVLLLPDRTVLRPEFLDHLLLRCLEHRIPVIGLSALHVRRGALFALAVTPDDVAVDTARVVERLLGGERAPVLDRRRLSLHLNQRTADRLGLVLPEAVLRRAATVVR